MQGKIIKGIAGFYYVYVEGAGIYECRAKGIFRNRKIKPLVGDDVLLSVVDEGEKIGNVDEILLRRRELLRPAVANVDMAVVIFACCRPQPNLNLLDRFLCRMEKDRIPTVICFNKCDLADQSGMDEFKNIYEPAGYPVLFTSTKNGEGL